MVQGSVACLYRNRVRSLQIGSVAYRGMRCCFHCGCLRRFSDKTVSRLRSEYGTVDLLFSALAQICFELLTPALLLYHISYDGSSVYISYTSGLALITVLHNTDFCRNVSL